MSSSMEEAFNALDWHDTELQELLIDRRAPGERDELVLTLRWPGPEGRTQRLRFTDCYALEANMNFGVIAPETLYTAHCVSDSPRLEAVRKTWAHLGTDLSGLRLFELETNSTSSTLRIVARGFELSDV
jgi:hypothetical protein